MPVVFHFAENGAEARRLLAWVSPLAAALCDNLGMNDLLRGAGHHTPHIDHSALLESAHEATIKPTTDMPHPISTDVCAAGGSKSLFREAAETRVLPSDRGLHELKDNRVVGVQIKIPDGHPLKQAIDNAFATDTQFKNPASAIKQYDRALKRNRTKDGAIKDTMVEMIGRARKGLALNHLVAAAIKDNKPHAELAEQAKAELRTAIRLGHGQGQTYGAPYYNLATLQAHLGEVEEGLAVLEQAIHSDPEFFQELSQKDGDLKPLAGEGFDELMQMKLTEARGAAVHELFGVEGVDVLLNKLSRAEAFHLKMGSTALHGPHYGIPLSMEVYLTAVGPMKAEQYRSDTGFGTVFVPLSHSQLSADSVQEMKDALRDLIAGVDNGTRRLALEGAFHEVKEA